MSDRLPMIDEEKRLLETVLNNLKRLKAGPAHADHAAQLTILRDSLSDEKLPEDIASIMEAMNRTAALMAQQSQHKYGTVNINRPYFGHLKLDDDFGKRSILIGKQTFISDRVRIVDWRNAPVSRLFYQYAEGDEYEETINDQEVIGQVKAKRTVGIDKGILKRVADEEHIWVLKKDGTWIDRKAAEAKLGGGQQTAVRPDSLGTGMVTESDKHLTEITGLLDPEQFKLITKRETGVVIVTGSAGSGKTTVALHRIAYLNFLAPNAFRPHRILVVVFSKALANYIAKVLPGLGIDGIKVQRFDHWAAWLCKMHFRGLPNRYSEDTPALVTRFKTHAALLAMLDETGQQHRNQRVIDTFEELFTDKSWIQRGLDKHAPGEFSPDQVKQIHRWCTDSHFRREDDPEDREEKPDLDQEDDAILLRLYQSMIGPLKFFRGNSPKGSRLAYDHIMVDECQDLSPIEVAIILGTANKRQNVTLAGDVAQSIAEHRDVRSWEHVLTALRLKHVRISPLDVSYRSTASIMRVAHEILGPYAPEEMATTTREGAPAAHLAFSELGEAVAWVAEALTDLMRREPLASVALLTPSLARAINWYDALDRSEVPSLSLVDDQDFSFAPGIEVTDIRASKGLEFDYVLLLDVDIENFPDSANARHLLHVGATRAAHQLWFVSTGRPSSLLPESLAGILEA
jgi:DNA helicase-2/ATP-dependent DNA helicase PcrA